MAVKLKRIYAPAEPDDGYRLLVMRFWPRGVRKDAIHGWNKGLAPTQGLLAAFNSGVLDWEDYSQRYFSEMANREDSVVALASLCEQARCELVTLLCWCAEENRCHRSLLRDLVLA